MNCPSATLTAAFDAPHRSATLRRYVMCAPRFCSVQYQINPWMTAGTFVDVGAATEQWQRLVDTYRLLGHTVELLDSDPALPDMVFAANGGIVVDGKAFSATFVYPQRAAEANHHRAWFARNGLTVSTGRPHPNEGEGDFLLAGEQDISGHRFSDQPAGP